MKIAIQGIEGCFHQIAANKHFEKKIDILCCESFPTLITEVEKGTSCDLGIMAIENTIAGSILQNYMLLQHSNVKIIGEVYLPIVQNLIVFPGVKLSDINEVHSHPMAIYQCTDFLKTLKNIRVIETEDTAASVKKIKDNNWKTTAAISSELSASIYEMATLVPSIETNKENYTRFLILSKNEVENVKKTNKASIYFSLSNNKGNLAKVLELIARSNINLTKIQSFPIVGSSWQYYFHIDLEYEAYSNFNNMILQLKYHTIKIKILGNYLKGLK